MLTLPAPAKINLTLEVLGRRPDGYHEVRSVAQTIDLCDTLTFRPARGMDFHCESTEVVMARSLVPRAAVMLRPGVETAPGAAINLSKCIPLSAGLGGDSSDAAAVLYGLNRLWNLNLSREQLADIGARLGSDVSLFLYGGTLLTEGRGERVTPLPPLPSRWVLVFMPLVTPPPDKTKTLYAGLTPSHFTGGGISERLAAALRGNGSVTPDLLFNTFENIAFERFPGLGIFRDHVLKLGAPHCHLAGSGPALFTMLDDAAAARELFTRCRQQNIKCYLAETLNAADIGARRGVSG
jgi:4-diphosphocytidyl-2-C-methyl-D-erythritol kinase